VGENAHRLDALMTDLLNKIESFLEGVPLKSILLSAKKISDEYRQQGKRSASAHAQKEEILAYLVTRMPATHAALCRVFTELKKRMPQFTPHSMLDIGCGPGTALWTASDFFMELNDVHCLEKDFHFLSMAKRLCEDLWLYPHVLWQEADVKSCVLSKSYDLVVASYSLGEIPDAENELVAKLWERTNNVLILIEPGTPRGFKRLREVREYLLQKEAHLIAPCPHSGACPLKEDDWCHFYARLNRSSLHRRAKEAERNYEDEKFSYLIFSKERTAPCSARILRHPRKGKGYVQFTLCTQDGLEDTIVTKKDKELYSIAKKAEWGDAFS
jgi:ribosomal protein RSM22 (predicted rRNA methylase)